ncbi:hypothetical protein [Epilithonimonas sp.]|uniref:hypothetical protein n=1 Tax=Epilithonimonas sp. TaxID=2894511 RepID=UPI00289ED3E2|nr:hypothetical protein [Epilithonimonas sp.]
MKHPKKIYYFPGLISAVIIPILFWFYGNRELNKPIPNVIDIGLPAKEIGKPNLSFEPYRNWNYKKIIVKPNTARRNSDYYVSELKKMQQRNQKNTGLEFIIDEQNSYDDFISLFNDMAIVKQETYALDIEKTGHFFATVNYQDPKLDKYENECLLCNDLITITDGGGFYQPKFFENFQRNIVLLPKQTFYLIFGFLIFLNISLFSIKESLQKH